MENIQGGVIEQYSELDYGDELLVGSMQGLNNLPDIKIPINYEYHQPEVSNSSCTIHAGVGAISNLYDNKTSLDTRKELWEDAKEKGAGEGSGWYINKAVDLIRKWSNDNYEEVTTFKIQNGSQTFYELLEKGYICQTGFRGNMALIRDKNDDGIMNSITEIEKQSFGHSVDMFYKDGSIHILDSFKNTAKYNIYRVDNFDLLVKNKVFFENSYFYIPLKNLNMEKEDLEFNAMLKLAKEAGISNCERLLENATREETIVMISRVYKKLKAELDAK